LDRGRANGVTRRIRVLHVITRFIVGGAQEAVLYIAIGQHRNPGYDVTILAGVDGGAEGDLHQAARDAGIRLVLVPTMVRPIRPLLDIRTLLWMVGFMRRERFDIVHTHSSKAGILGRLAARMAGVPIVVHTLHSLVFHEYERPWKNRVYVLLKRLVAPLTDTLISVCDATALGARKAGIGRPEQHVTIFTGFEVGPFAEAARTLDVREAKRRAGLDPNAPVVGKIARLTPLKGHHQFLAVAKRIAAIEPDTQFLLVGDGSLREELERLFREAGLARQTRFTGLVSIDKVPGLIQAMDVVVHTSLREGLARVLPQASAVGKPVVTFALDGAPEAIEDRVSGYLVPALDTDQLADRVVELLRDPERSRAFGEAGRAYAVENFSVERMVTRIDAVYDRLLVAKRLRSNR
jgi:glycosyltransferase involved in cell wall biosynthesis